VGLGSPAYAVRRLSANQDAYLNLLGLQAPVYFNTHFQRITILEDVGQNEYKRERYAELRNLAGKKHRVPDCRRVMLLRGSTGLDRFLVNEGEVAAAAAERGFVVLDPVTASVSEIIRTCLHAEIVLGVEGSQLCNGLMWMSPQGALVTLQPPTRFTTVLKDRCDCEGIRYAFMVGDWVGGHDFRIDISALHRLLDAVEGTGSQHHVQIPARPASGLQEEVGAEKMHEPHQLLGRVQEFEPSTPGSMSELQEGDEGAVGGSHIPQLDRRGTGKRQGLP
jgi:hypothetical protein